MRGRAAAGGRVGETTHPLARRAAHRTIHSRRRRAYGLDPKHVNAAVITQKVIQGVYDGVTTAALDDLAAETAAYLTTQHPDYARLAARISVSNLHKMTDKCFSTVMNSLHKYINPKNGQKAPLIADDVFEIVQANKDRLDAAIMCARHPGRELTLPMRGRLRVAARSERTARRERGGRRAPDARGGHGEDGAELCACAPRPLVPQLRPRL
jgi:hypothetical protein